MFYLCAVSGCSDCGGACGREGSHRALRHIMQLPLRSPCSAPAPPCHHRSHCFPQQGGGAPVPEQGLLGSQDLHGGGRVLGQVGQAAGVGDETSSHLQQKDSVTALEEELARGLRLRAEDHQHRSGVVIAEIQGIDRLWYNIIGPTSSPLKLEDLKNFRTTSPIRAARLGATWPILERRYSWSSSR